MVRSFLRICPYGDFSNKIELHALVAQRLEQQTHNLLVVGSNPTEGMPLGQFSISQDHRMKFEGGIDEKYRRSVQDAFSMILGRGTELQKEIVKLILASTMLIRVRPVSEINASGSTGLIDVGSTNDRIEAERLSLRESLGEIYIAIAEETIDTGGQRGCEGTLVHEGRHAYDFAQTIESFSHADINPLSIFDPTLYELELEAHKTSGDYMLCIDKDEYLGEGLGLMILSRKETSGPCYVDNTGIHRRLFESYGLSPDGNQGPRASELLGLRQKHH